VNKQEFSASSWRSNQGYTKMHGEPSRPSCPVTNGLNIPKKRLQILILGFRITLYPLRRLHNREWVKTRQLWMVIWKECGKDVVTACLDMMFCHVFLGIDKSHDKL